MVKPFSPVAANGDAPPGQGPARAKRTPRQRRLTERIRFNAAPAQRRAWEDAAHAAGVTTLANWYRHILCGAVGISPDADNRDPALGDGSRPSSSPDADAEAGAGLSAKVQFSVSPETRRTLDATARADGTTLSQLMRVIVAAHLSSEPVEPPPRRRVATTADPALVGQVHAIGHNLNQITRQLNGAAKAGLLVSGSYDLRRLADKIAGVEAQLSRLEHLSVAPGPKEE